MYLLTNIFCKRYSGRVKNYGKLFTILYSPFTFFLRLLHFVRDDQRWGYFLEDLRSTVLAGQETGEIK